MTTKTLNRQFIAKTKDGAYTIVTSYDDRTGLVDVTQYGPSRFGHAELQHKSCNVPPSDVTKLVARRMIFAAAFDNVRLVVVQDQYRIAQLLRDVGYAELAG
jgi:hypothetical protein